MAKYLTIIFLSVFAIACVKPPDYPIEPLIDFLRLDKNTLSQGLDDQDFVLATISFTDGDGDIGSSNDSISIVITDLRDNSINTSATELPEVPSQGAGNGISGEITFRLFQTCCIWPPQFQQAPCTPSSNYPVDTLRYEVFIRDKAGNESNRIVLDPIYLFCD
ncbi:MAG: hypothetical protein R2784_17760 [Saprospiraceae bacterium]